MFLTQRNMVMQLVVFVTRQNERSIHKNISKYSSCFSNSIGMLLTENEHVWSLSLSMKMQSFQMIPRLMKLQAEVQMLK